MHESFVHCSVTLNLTPYGFPSYAVNLWEHLAESHKT